MVHVFAHIKSKPGHEAELRVILLQLGEASRNEEGVLRYDVFETCAAGEFLFQEEYASDAAFLAHKDSTHLRRAVRQALRHMDGGLTLWEVRPVGAGINVSEQLD